MRSEPPKEVKSEIIRARQAIEVALNAWPDRWVLCWNGSVEEAEFGTFDCACCISWEDFPT